MEVPPHRDGYHSAAALSVKIHYCKKYTKIYSDIK